MGLFEVPGWTVSAEPVGTSVSGSKSKKRKRDDDKNLTNVAKNVEVLMRQLGKDGSPVQKNQKKRKGEGRERRNSVGYVLSGEDGMAREAAHSPQKKKKEKGDRPKATVGTGNEDATITPLQSKMKRSLEGAKFR
jgi:hypothetical protein